jgi:hypothetical protein
LGLPLRRASALRFRIEAQTAERQPQKAHRSTRTSALSERLRDLLPTSESSVFRPKRSPGPSELFHSVPAADDAGSSVTALPTSRACCSSGWIGIDDPTQRDRPDQHRGGRTTRNGPPI